MIYGRRIALALAIFGTSVAPFSARAADIERPVRIGLGGIVPMLDRLDFKMAQDAAFARLVHEPLFDVDRTGDLQPRIAREIPTRENGGISVDGRTIVYRLRAT